MDCEGCYIAILTAIISAICILLGLCIGLDANHKDFAVVKEVSISKSENGKYEYTTNQFDFVSDSVYQVGDTIKITKY